MISIDTSGWVEYFLNGAMAERYAEIIHGKEPIVTSTIVVYETYKIVKRQMGDQFAVEVAQHISKTQLVPLGPELACEAADESLERGLAMADAIVYATARSFGAKLITSDSDFKNLPNVTYIPLEEPA